MTRSRCSFELNLKVINKQFLLTHIWAFWQQRIWHVSTLPCEWFRTPARQKLLAEFRVFSASAMPEWRGCWRGNGSLWPIFRCRALIAFEFALPSHQLAFLSWTFKQWFASYCKINLRIFSQRSFACFVSSKFGLFLSSNCRINSLLSRLFIFINISLVDFLTRIFFLGIVLERRFSFCCKLIFLN